MHLIQKLLIPYFHVYSNSPHLVTITSLICVPHSLHVTYSFLPFSYFLTISFHSYYTPNYYKGYQSTIIRNISGIYFSLPFHIWTPPSWATTKSKPWVVATHHVSDTRKTLFKKNRRLKYQILFILQIFSSYYFIHHHEMVVWI